MDYAQQIKKFAIGKNFTFKEYRNLKRKPPKVETKPSAKKETDAESKE